MKKQELIQNLKDLRDNYPDNGRYDGVRQGLLIAIGAIQNLEEPKKVVIPKFVAAWIEEMKQDERPLYSVMSTLMNKTKHEWAVWKSANMNFSEIVAQAWLGGYEIEKEKLYIVQLPTNLEDDLIILDADGYIWKDSWPSRYKMTEKRIKEIDERYWLFAKEVAE